LVREREILMRTLTWHGTSDIRCETVPDPKIEDHRDAIIKVAACVIFRDKQDGCINIVLQPN
jgi:threonine dehydrogenase-like Zn-dependent dehydrogenase